MVVNCLLEPEVIRALERNDCAENGAPFLPLLGALIKLGLE
jgi:hypothetical protein